MQGNTWHYFVRIDRPYLLLYNSTWLKGQIEGSLSSSETKFIIKSSLIVIGLHDVNVFFETMISNIPPRGIQIPNFLGFKKIQDENRNLCILHCIDQVINMIGQARYCWEQKNSGILAKKFMSQMYSFSFLFQ